MQTVLAQELFKNNDYINTINLDDEAPITVDFSGVNNFELKSLYTLLSLQRLAIYNDTELRLQNITPPIEKMLFDTGIYKTFTEFCSNPIRAHRNLSFD